tara:strand:- start:17 stop:4087 length:4071 start_codon:yes stop_codon:yes gene_type:complete
MITLQPISKNIQSTLYEKIEMMKKHEGRQLANPDNPEPPNRPYIIGEPMIKNGNRNLNYMMARTPWLRMTSFTPINEDLEPIVMMGGELNSFGKPGENFDATNQDFFQTSFYDWEHDRGSKYIGLGKLMPYRPLPGVKDISVEYKGGGMKLGATRTAEISWTCWTWEELDRLTPHFLDAGRSVLLEWGWSGLGKLKSVELLDIFKVTTGEGESREGLIGSRQLDPEKIKNLNQTILGHVQEQNGHYDGMLGLIQDFSWDVNDTGGFDCTTTLVAQGVSMIAANEKKSMSRGDKFANLPLITMKEGSDPTKETPTKTLSSLAPYISYLDYMEDFHEQILNYNSTDSVAIFAINKVNNKDHAGFEDGGAFFVSWGYFEDNVLSRFLSSVTADKKVVGEFRSIEQSTDDYGRLMKIENQEDPNDGKPIMQSTRFTNCRYLMTTNSAKWVIPNKLDPFLSDDKFILYKGREGMIGSEESKWHRDGEEQKWHISKNPVIQHFAPRDVGGDYDDKFMEIRNVFFNVKYLQEKCKGSGNLMKVVDDIWNDFSDEYAGVYKFKVEFDDNTNRLLVREEGYSRFDVKDLNASLYTEAEAVAESEPTPIKMNNPLFEFPTMKQGSIVKTQTISAKLPDRMKQAAMYGQRSVAKGTDDKNEDIIRGGTYDDVAGLAWGRMAESIPHPPDETMSEEEKKSKRYRDMMSGDVDFPSRGNRAFGNVGADPNLPLVVGNTPSGSFDEGTEAFVYDELPAAAERASTIDTTILGALNTSQQKYLVNRKNRDKKQAESTDVKVTQQIGTKDDIKLTDVQKAARELMATFDAFSVTGRSKNANAAIEKGKGFELYEAINLKDTTKYTWAIKPEAHNMLDKRLRGSIDGILKNINPLIPIDFEIEVDGTGGMFPGNSFHSAYLGGAYKNQSLFQMVGVNHTVDSSGWFTTIKGQIRAQSVLTEGVSHVAKQVAAEKKEEDYQKKLEEAIQNCKNDGGEYDEATGKCIMPTSEVVVAKKDGLDVILIDLVTEFLENEASEAFYKAGDSPSESVQASFNTVKGDAWNKVVNHIHEGGEKGDFWKGTAAYSEGSGNNPFGKFIQWFNKENNRYWGAELARIQAEQEGNELDDADCSDETVNNYVEINEENTLNLGESTYTPILLPELFSNFGADGLDTNYNDEDGFNQPSSTYIKNNEYILRDEDTDQESGRGIDANNVDEEALAKQAAALKAKADQKALDEAKYNPQIGKHVYITRSTPDKKKKVMIQKIDYDNRKVFMVVFSNTNYNKWVSFEGWDSSRAAMNVEEPTEEENLEPSGTGTSDDPFMNMNQAAANALAVEAHLQAWGGSSTLNFYHEGGTMGHLILAWDENNQPIPK